MDEWGDDEDRRMCSGTLCTGTKPCLFDVVADEAERHDLAAEHPGIVASMLARLKEIQKSYWSAPQMPDNGRFCDVMKANGGFYGPWIPDQ